MPFRIRMGVPEMELYWRDLVQRKNQHKLGKNEERFFKKLVKTLGFLSANPRRAGLVSHEIDDLSRKYQIKIFQSYLENRTPRAGRIFWAYGPEKQDITVLAIEAHPEDRKRGAYERVRISGFPRGMAVGGRGGKRE